MSARFGCDNAANAFLFGGGSPSGVSESGTITVTVTLSTGQVFTSSQPYGTFSTPESLAAGFGGDISNKYYPTLSAQSFGKTLLMVPGSATLASVVFQNASRYLTITPITDAVLSGTGNTVGVSTAAANLAVLGAHGGPTQTVLPLPGSVALCAAAISSTAGTDQRGLPRTTAVGTLQCQDSGAVQANYALAFVQQPANASVNAVLTPAPSVQVAESGQNLSQANVPVTLKDLSGALSGGTSGKTAAAGIATFTTLTVTRAQPKDILTASLAVGANSVSATSSAFDVTTPATASLIGSPFFPSTALLDTYTRVFTFNNTSTSTLTITALAVTGAPEWTQTNTCGLTVTAGASCTATVTFQPAVEGTRSSVLKLSSDATGYAQTVALTGTGASPTAALTGNAAFPDTVVGSTSPAQVFTLRNTGTVALTVRAITLSRDFTQSNTCGIALGAGASCTLSVVFAPAVTGARSAVLAIDTNASVTPSGLLLGGNGVLAPALALADATAGGSSTAITVLAGSTGSGVLRLSSLNGFAGAVTLACGAPAAAPAGATCTVASPVTLTAGGTAMATVTLTTTSRVLSAGPAMRSRDGWPVWLLVLGTVATALSGLRFGNRVSRTGGLLLLLCALGLGVSSCGGTDSAAGSVRTNPSGTPAGSYAYVVTAISGSLTVTQAVTLTVQ